jgi:hypothetical protein
MNQLAVSGFTGSHSCEEVNIIEMQEIRAGNSDLGIRN